MSPQQSIPPKAIAHYKLTSKLGEGGMGAVYRATDTKLNRDVAIKVLPEAFAQDAARMARFEREAQVLASLNHPNIAAIYGLEQGAIVMELVEGADLTGPVPIETAIGYAKQIVAGLEAAHERGIVHRDLKPANIKVTPEGTVKLLDFGLAKAGELSSAASSAAADTMSPTLSLAMTQAGMILGTAAYMSPEQARGKPVDKRADIGAFGVVLFEMLTGKALFAHGDTVTDIIAAVVTREPEWDTLPKDTPPHVARLLRRCLRKDPKLRLRDIGDARIALDEPPAALPVTAPPVRGRRPWIWVAATGILAVAAAAGWWRASQPPDRPLLNLSVDLGADAIGGTRISFALSRDGARIAYLHAEADGPPSLAIRELDQPKGKVLAGTVGAESPFFSPDGQWIGFFADGKLKKISVAGGAPIPLANAPSGRGGDWNEDGRIVFAPDRSAGIFVVGENGGSPQPLIKREDGEASQRWPQWLPGGDAVLFGSNSTPTDWDNATVFGYSLKTGRRKILVHGGYFGRYLPGGYLVYQRGGKLFALRFNPGRVETFGAPVVLLEDVAGNRGSGGGQLDFSRHSLAYMAGKPRLSSYPFGWMAAGGALDPVKGAPPRNWWFPRLSPDGKLLAITDPAGSLSVWDFERETMTPLATQGLRPMPVIWTPDSRHVIYADSFEAFGIWWRPADGSGEPVKILPADEPVLPSSTTPDGKFLLYSRGLPDHSSVWIAPLSLDDPRRPTVGASEVLLQQSASAQYAVFSPDGRWIAYSSEETGSFEVFVRPFRGSGKWQVTTGGGSRPKWSRDGRQLFYTTPDQRVMVVEYSVSGDAFSPGRRRRWSDVPIGSGGGPPNFDIAPDGKRILAFPSDEDLDKGNLHVTLLVNFLDELKRRMP